MGSAKVRCGGVWLEGKAEVGNLAWSSRLVVDDYSGDWKASIVWGAPTGYSAPFVKAGQRFEIVEHGVVLWGGILGEPNPQDGQWELYAYGYGSLAQYAEAIVNTGDEAHPVWVPSTVPNAVVDAAIARGFPWRRFEDLGSVPIADPDGQVTNVLQLLYRAAQLQGKYVWFDSTGEITFVSEPTTPTLTVGPKDSDVGTADDTFCTSLYGFYISSINTNGLPDGYASVLAEDAEAIAQYGGRRERGIKLYQLGLLTETEARAFITGRFALVGARMAFTNAVNLSELNLRRLGAGPSSPRYVRAGTALRIPGIMDTRSQPETRASVTLPIAEYEFTDDDKTGVATPPGFKPRDFDAAFEEPEAPPTEDLP